MPLHPQAALAIKQAGDLPLGLSPDGLRRVYTEQRMKLLPPRPDIAVSYDISIPSPDGPIPARFYRAHERQASCPLLVYFHGGGFMLGSIESYDTVCRRLAIKGDCSVISVGYRLAPEHPFPAAVNDAYAATWWCSRNAARLGSSSATIAVGGDSAGGTLAAVVTQMSFDSKEFTIARQILIYPATEFERECPSYERNAKGYMLTAAATRWFFQHYLPRPADRSDVRASPARRMDLSGLAPALIISAEYDPLVDENETYANRLKEARVPTTYVCFAGMLHPFFTLGGVIEDAAKAEDLIAAELRAIA